MIHYALRCGSGHEFDGWFKSSAAFDAQAADGLLDCPVCADRQVERALMAPRVRTRRAAEPPAPQPQAAPETPPPAPPPAMADAMRAVLQRLRAEVEKNCEYVGPRFAQTVRMMHEGETERRAVYGEATEAESEALRDEGIEIVAIPWVPRADG